jgi:2-keto-4-pentenoate hydratase/2-oxohepta-3-ene-1,7-dioic acid hydratase in catechol pathway
VPGVKWASYQATDGDRVGLVVDGRIHAVPGVTRLIELLGDDGERLAAAADQARRDPLEVVEVSSTVLRAPIPVPPSIRDFMAFEEHVVNSRAAAGATVDPGWYEQPAFYFTNPAAVHAPRADVAISPGSSAFDYELEVGAVIGRGGGDLRPDEAEAHIAGYLVFCDWSARDLQGREMTQRLGPAKGKDSATSLGPYLVTPDEIADRRSGNGFDLRMTATVNGRTYSDGNWSTVYWSFPELLAYASRGTTLRPGDVFGSGTVGRGCILELSGLHGADEYPWLRAGDVVTLAIESLGEVRARVTAGTGAPVPLR